MNCGSRKTGAFSKESRVPTTIVRDSTIDGIRRAKDGKNLYWILACLVREAKRIDMTATLLSHGLMKQEVKKSTTMVQRKLFDLWKQYETSGMNSLTLVENCVCLLKSNFPKLDALEPTDEDLYDDGIDVDGDIDHAFDNVEETSDEESDDSD